MRRSQHSIDMCAYEVTSKGLAIGEPMRGYRALTSGIPGPWLESGENEPELSDPSRSRAAKPGKPARKER
jgi:circadian clock protein KaiC